MKLHKREKITNEANLEYTQFIIKFLEKYDLTTIEYLQILNKEISTSLKYALRIERHGDTNKPSGLE